MLTLHIEAPTLAELREKATAALGGVFAEPLTATAETSASPPARARRAGKSEETQASSPSPEPSATSQPTQSEATTTEPDGGATSASPSDEPKTNVALGYEADVKPAVLKLAEAKGRDTVIALLKDWKVDTAKDVPESDYAAFLADIEKRKAA